MSIENQITNMRNIIQYGNFSIDVKPTLTYICEHLILNHKKDMNYLQLLDNPNHNMTNLLFMLVKIFNSVLHINTVSMDCLQDIQKVISSQNIYLKYSYTESHNDFDITDDGLKGTIEFMHIDIEDMDTTFSILQSLYKYFATGTVSVLLKYTNSEEIVNWLQQNGWKILFTDKLNNLIFISR